MDANTTQHVGANEYQTWARMAVDDVRNSLTANGFDWRDWPQIENEELESVAYVAIASAVAEFDPARGTLVTHAIKQAKYAVYHELRDFYGVRDESLDDLIAEARTDEIVGDDPEPPRSLIESEQLEAMHRAIADLDDAHKAVALGLLDGQTQREIAAAMGISQQRVSVLYGEVLTLVRRAMGLEAGSGRGEAQAARIMAIDE